MSYVNILHDHLLKATHQELECTMKVGFHFLWCGHVSDCIWMSERMHSERGRENMSNSEKSIARILLKLVGRPSEYYVFMYKWW